VVIAIIGILASVVLASLNTARKKGNDAKVKAQLSGLRVAAELYWDSAGNYGITTNACSGGVGNMFADTASNMATYVDGANYPAGTTITCRAIAAPASYAVSANLSDANAAAFPKLSLVTWQAETPPATKLLSTLKNYSVRQRGIIIVLEKEGRFTLRH